MISFSQGVSRPTSNCTFRCLGCPLGQRDFQPDPALDPLFSPHKKVMHIVGGDPLCATTLIETLRHYHQKGSHLVLWTHGQFEVTRWAEILPFRPKVMLYLPSPDEAQFNLISGVSGWSGFHQIAAYLQSKNVEIAFNFPVRPGQLEFVPDAHELAQAYHARLLMQYHPEDFGPEGKAYLQRYLNFSDVWVFESPAPPPLFCPAFAYEGVLNPWQVAKNFIWDYVGSKGKLWTFGG